MMFVRHQLSKERGREGRGGERGWGGGRGE